ncbi:Os02g0652575 [Oryza sativa Japonica Group]|uniref:Os02g0652575 protein n=1 Tax=Oryza sativa subsp. japonica TaxID=39947 RepID=A0A0P0VMM9_ORYSJ|nr:hypothetical protein EE612_012736 [Oryza sativa]BAS80069.1 Os02g0652575 [Oryza sativa Japonica Group]
MQISKYQDETRSLKRTTAWHTRKWQNWKHVFTCYCARIGNMYLLVIVQESHGWTMFAFGRTKYFLGDVVLT